MWTPAVVVDVELPRGARVARTALRGPGLTPVASGSHFASAARRPQDERYPTARPCATSSARDPCPCRRPPSLPAVVSRRDERVFVAGLCTTLRRIGTRPASRSGPIGVVDLAVPPEAAAQRPGGRERRVAC